MQVPGSVQGDCNLLDRLMLWRIVTPLTLPDGDSNPKGSSHLAGIYTINNREEQLEMGIGRCTLPGIMRDLLFGFGFTSV